MKTVPLYGAKAAGRVALVDHEDYDLVMQYRWNLWEYERPGGRKRGPYAIANLRGGGTITMHKLLTGYRQTDHENHNGLDNRRSNLRDATAAQNAQNRRKRSDSRSRFKGVLWLRQTSRWCARIRVAGKERHLGSFTDEVDAAKAYNAAAIEAFGEFACLNDVGAA